MSARIMLVTVSDTRTPADDTSGDALALALSEFEVMKRAIVPDEVARIHEALAAAQREAADAIVFTGGTGISPRDVTYEAIATKLDKTLDGFGEAFRRLSWDEIGPRALLSRATAGTIGTLLVFCLPGSTKAARLGAKELIAPILAHAVDLTHGRTKHR
ncbi:MAG: molybdenum cofactor biosynthesis protein MoaB [Labilithrix sp.]|nr:molybdenum cofactor biosynthesis protein MoaB [Labilithrix sp.]MCW5816351.1 molybdenum cofactor biosynthesis protein MoaB [Labilithrix sp.]